MELQTLPVWRYFGERKLERSARFAVSGGASFPQKSARIRIRHLFSFLASQHGGRPPGAFLIPSKPKL